MGNTGYKLTYGKIYQPAGIHKTRKLARTYVKHLLYSKNSEIITIKLKLKKKQKNTLTRNIT